MPKDLQHALRLIRKNPGFSLAVIAIMEFSIGACTSIFSIHAHNLTARSALPFKLLHESGSRHLTVQRHEIYHVREGIVDGWSPIQKRSHLTYRRRLVQIRYVHADAVWAVGCPC